MNTAESPEMSEVRQLTDPQTEKFIVAICDYMSTNKYSEIEVLDFIPDEKFETILNFLGFEVKTDDIHKRVVIRQQVGIA